MFKYDLHVHTSEVSPCGNVSAKDLVRLYKEKGYDGVVITDHMYAGFFRRHPNLTHEECCREHFKGFEAARAEGERLGFLVLQGMELRVEENPNDYLVFGLPQEFIMRNPGITGWTLGEFREKTKDLGILVIQAHPFRPHMVQMPAKLLDGVEAYNGNKRHDSRDDVAKRYAEENDLIAVSGSDFHELEDLARGGIITQERVQDMQHLIDILQNRRFERIENP